MIIKRKNWSQFHYFEFFFHFEEDVSDGWMEWLICDHVTKCEEYVKEIGKKQLQPIVDQKQWWSFFFYFSNQKKMKNFKWDLLLVAFIDDRWINSYIHKAHLFASMCTWCWIAGYHKRINIHMHYLMSVIISLHCVVVVIKSQGKNCG